MNNSRLAAGRALEQVFREKEHQHIVEWADEHFWLPPSSSNNPDMIKWKTFGYQKLGLHAMADLDTYLDVGKKPVQIGESKCTLIGIGYESAHRNRSNGVWLPSRADANEYSNVQITDMLRHVVEVRESLTVDFDRKDKDNTTRRRSFKGAQSYCRATQTLQDVSSVPVEHVFGDEVSKYPRALKGGKDDEGKAPIDGLKGRLKSANDPCITLRSTPTEHGVCQITHEFEKCREQFERGYFCPSCDNWHVFEWGDEKSTHGFKWEKKYFDDGTADDLETAKTVYYQCPHCDHKHYWEDLEDLDENRGEYRSENLRFDEKEFKYYSLDTGELAPSPYSVGVQLRGWFNRRDPWWQICLGFLESVRDLAQGNPKKMVDWTQDYKAEAYQSPEDSDYVRHGYLMARKEGVVYDAVCPAEVQVITKDWDVQADRIECLTVGWTTGRECFLIRKYVYWGDPATSNVLEHAQKHTEKTYEKANGFKMPVFLSGIDAKYLPDRVNSFCTGEFKYKLIPHMGSTSLGKPLVQGRTHANKNHGTFLTTLCVDTGKDLIYRMYLVETPGPGFVHIPDIDCFDESFIKQMVAETKKILNGKRRWVCAKGVRNEGLDLMVGNLAMIMLAEQRLGFYFVPKNEYKDEYIEEADEDVSIDEIIKARNG